MHAQIIKNALQEYGEIEVVLESGTRYELHRHDTEFGETIRTEGTIDGEYVVAHFPASAVEHYTYHRVS